MALSKIIRMAAAAVFASHPDATELYVTEDGNAWLPEVKGLAHTHAASQKLPAPVCVQRSELSSTAAELKAQKEAEVASALRGDAQPQEEAPAQEQEQPQEEVPAQEQKTAKPKGRNKGK